MPALCKMRVFHRELPWGEERRKVNVNLKVVYKLTVGMDGWKGQKVANRDGGYFCWTTRRLLDCHKKRIQYIG